jgi:hypothetical protein
MALRAGGEWEAEEVRRCERCHRHGGRVRSARLCVDCRAAGWRWCAVGRHLVRVQEYIEASRRVCYDCRREENRRQKLAARGVAIDPPPGYVPMVEVCHTLGYSQAHVAYLLRRGVLTGWQRTRGGKWYVKVPQKEER